MPKVHKDTCPARPIMSANGPYNYGLAKFLVPMLQSLTSNQYTVDSSFSFAKEITDISFPHNTGMVSFDASSLFTNIPLDETANIIQDSLFSENEFHFVISNTFKSTFLYTYLVIYSAILHNII